MTGRALMIRIVRSFSVWATTSRRPPADRPIVRKRLSDSEWSISGNVIASGSPKIVAASRNPTPCLRRFVASLRGSHSNSIRGQYNQPNRVGLADSRPLIAFSLHYLLIRGQRQQREILSIQVIHQIEHARKARSCEIFLIPRSTLVLRTQQIRDAPRD